MSSLTVTIGLLFWPVAWWPIRSSMALCVAAWATYMLFSKPTSYPGPARKRKIMRHPQWDHTMRYSDLEQWRCALAGLSHDVTHHERPGDITLTGESAGRQTWTQTPFSQVGGQDVPYDKSAKALLGVRDFAFEPNRNPNSADLLFRCGKVSEWLARGKPLPDTTKVPATALEAAQKGLEFYQMLQCEDGHWAGDYGGPHFLLPGLVVAWYMMGKPADCISDPQQQAMAHYLRAHQQADGGWGTHIESPSTMFGSVLCYISLRLLGAQKDDSALVRGRNFIKENGGALYTSSWAKFWLCVLGVMDWAGHNSIPVELWLLPDWFPFHPARLWCHCRMVYLPMGYLFCSRCVYPNAETDPVTLSLREELYVEDYKSINWERTRHLIAPMDEYSAVPLTMRLLQDLLAIYERPVFAGLRSLVRHAGLRFCQDYMEAEDIQTNYVDIGPVNKVMNMLSAWHAGGMAITPALRRHFLRVPDYLWVAEDGMKMQGYNGSQMWDTSLAIQGVLESGLAEKFPDVCKGAWRFVERTQILSTETSQATEAFKYEEPALRKKYNRHVSQGGWPFSTSAHGWPISDCTAEGVKAVCSLLKTPCIQQGLAEGQLRAISEERLSNGVEVILTLQNPDGGFPTYENARGYLWYEQLNPSDVFGDIMIDYSYVECSSASIQALCAFHQQFPNHRREEIEAAIAHTRSFLRSIQRPDGSWYGSWACCFTYGIWFGVEGLLAAGEPLDSLALKRAVTFLLKQQNANGGWGEDFRSCFNKQYPKEGMELYGNGGSGVVPTSWALLALMAAKCSDSCAVRRGVQYLMAEQQPSGDWPQQGISGVFNRSCGITYTAYRNLFPIWALGRYASHYLPEVEKAGLDTNGVHHQ
eukprot:GGOE01001427.1.p1 GENE.GGOE01001427.1~~GGOE01001427.1.p1  ORF type:complete len:940 (-),score=217.60 GGOE01001427.1:403-3012(-)